MAGITALETIGQKAKAAEPALRILDAKTKNQVLYRAAQALKDEAEAILAANALDMEAGKERGMKEGLLDRLKLTEERIEGMAEGLCRLQSFRIRRERCCLRMSGKTDL